MFRTVTAADPPTDLVDPPSVPNLELIPLSVLALDLPAPAEWSVYLADRGVQIVLDDLGRASVSCADARRLFTERREAEARSREMAAEQERQAIEADQRWRAQLTPGLPAAALQGFETYGQAIASHELDSQQYRPRATLVADVLDNSADTMIFHPIRHDDEE
jgi:hypothetical protein